MRTEIRVEPPETTARAIPDAAETFRIARTRMAPGLALAQKLAGGSALEASADGVTVTLSNGRTLLDFGSYGVTLLGHRNPAVIAAVQRQLATLPASTRILANAAAPALCRRLVELTGAPSLTRVWLGQNGTDAVEAALKLARMATGRRRVVALAGGFHGKTLGALSVTSGHRYRGTLEPLLTPGVHLAADLTDAEHAVRRPDTAAVIIEPIQGEAGIRPLDQAALRRVVTAAKISGVFVISDEIQVGLRRCGPVSLAISANLEPDAVLYGKHLGGGIMPVSAVVCGEEMFAPMLSDPFVHTATFSGHPLGCAAASAAIEEIEARAAHGTRLADHLRHELGDLAARWPHVVTQIRGRGLAWAIEFTDAETAGRIFADLSTAGLLVSPCLGRPEALRLLPPIVATAAHVERAVAIFDEVIGRVVAEGAAR
ncbi:class-III pyridoxal-phosphate-dependent aminotransferase [Nocardia mexicana]|uniref:Acetylornithine aminotransferase n=1 Tax=Nocardia mexicana TaxID=279262 RepID=A0A370HE99_9NOCA|nr:aspartate aminotransferase family protein [Nocardia mexicana]RDI55578.1 acetylornithine aminotransferase [Nocardia mexicana]